MYFNTITSLGGRVIAILSGLILPRLYLTYYGSSTYGLVSSINQFLSIVALMEFGIGVVVQSSLYKPLAEKNTEEISKIYKSASEFFTKIAMIFIIYLVALMLFYPSIISDYSFFYVSSLIFIISVSQITQYFLGIVNKLLLVADQKNYIVQLVNVSFIILNFMVVALLIINEISIHYVKLASAFIFVLRPLLLMLYVNSNYKIDRKIKFQEEPIKQKWNGIAHHIAYYVVNNTDVIVLTLFSKTPLTSVSIYSVYYMITNGLKIIFESVVSGGFIAYFGDMLSKREVNIKNRFLQFEWLIHTVVILIFTSCGLLILKFVLLYTNGVDDANYHRPIFGYLITLATASFCLRLPYNTIVRAAGHYKETQSSAIIEMLINIIVSLILIFKYDIVGVAVGTFLAMSYRMVYFANYLKNILEGYSLLIFIKHLVVDLLSVFCIVMISKVLPEFTFSFIGWLLSAILVFIISLGIALIVNIIFYKKEVVNIYKMLKSLC